MKYEVGIILGLPRGLFVAVASTAATTPGIGKLFGSILQDVVVAKPGTGRTVIWDRAATEISGYSPDGETTCPSPPGPPKDWTC